MNDRRSSCRYPAVVQHAVLSWEHAGSPVQVEAHLKDVSTQGCLARTARTPFPEPGTLLHMRVPSVRADLDLAGQIVSVQRKFFRKQLVRIHFPTPLPFELFKILAYGPNAARPPWETRPEYEKDYFWR